MASLATDVIALPSAVERALATFPPDVAARAAAALRICLHERLIDDDERAWTTSRLTGSGFPVEVTFTTADDRLRYTVEPGNWRDAPHDRRDTATQLLSRLAGATLPEAAISRLHRAQPDSGLRFGAWLGGRHGAAGSTQDEFKLYLETPDNDQADDINAMLPGPRLPDRAPALRMVACTPATQGYETYYRISSLAPYHLPRILAPCGLEARSGDLLDYLTNAYGHPFRERLPGSSVGVSYAMSARGEPQSVTIFTFARVFWGGDARIRERFGILARALGWDDSRYQQITAGLASRRSWTTHHGIFGVTLTRDEQLFLSIGVRPPEADAPAST